MILIFMLKKRISPTKLFTIFLLKKNLIQKYSSIYLDILKKYIFLQFIPIFLVTIIAIITIIDFITFSNKEVK